jgi:hypothetical protein
LILPSTALLLLVELEKLIEFGQFGKWFRAGIIGVPYDTVVTLCLAYWH